MEFRESLRIYNITDKDLKEIKELKNFFSDETKRTISKETLKFIKEKLQKSSQIIEDLQFHKSFIEIISKFLDKIFDVRKIDIYIDVIARTHLKYIPTEDFIKDYGKFLQNVINSIQVPEEKLPTFKKFIFILILVSYCILFKQISNRLEEQNSDSVTKLPSKIYLIRNFSKLLKKSRTIAIIDINDFKNINIYYGFQAGNSILTYMASFLKSIFKQATIARVQNDEFFILSEEPPETVFQKLRNLQNDLKSIPFEIPVKSGIEKIVIFFTGVILETERCKNMDYNTLFWILYKGIKKAKKKENNIEIIYRDEISSYILQRKLTLDVIEAIRKRKIKIRLQKIENLINGKLLFKESLARIPASDSIIEAEKFIKLVCQTNIEEKLDILMVEKLLEIYKKKKPNFPISINLSSLFMQNKFNWFLDRITKEKIEPGKIIVELTEREDILAIPNIVKKVNILKKRGIKVFVDDFGVKYANYELLRILPVDGVKIDGSIIKNITTNELDQLFVTYVFKLAQMRNLKIVAEYIEKKETKEKLVEISSATGFTELYGQGFLIGKPEIVSI
ncbi:EAL domain-containing protein [Desulfurobacterium indicum]|nr:GGDEF domain-containing protein [Desulfurobacterium indicum]